MIPKYRSTLYTGRSPAVLYCFQSCTAHNPASVLCPVSYDGSQPEQKCQTSAGEPFSFPSTGKIRESLHGH